MEKSLRESVQQEVPPTHSVDANPHYSPTCLVQEDTNEYQLLFRLRDDAKYELKLLFSLDKKRLHVLAKRTDGSENDQYLWSFKIPKMTRLSEIQFDQRNSLFLLHIPKKRFLESFENLFPSKPQKVSFQTSFPTS